MKTKVLILSILASVLLFACSSKPKEPTVKVEKTLSFETREVDIHYRNIGTYFDKQRNEDIIYFYVKDQNTLKRFRLLSGELLDTVYLDMNKNPMTSEDRIHYFSVFAHDTILTISSNLSSYQKQKFISFDSKGEIFHVKHVNDLLPDSLKNIVPFYFLRNPNSFSKNNFFLNFGLSGDYIEKYGTDCITENNCIPSTYNQISLNLLPACVNVKNLYSDTTKLYMVLNDYFHKHYQNTNLYIEVNFFFTHNNNLYIYTRQHNKISIYDSDTYEHIKDIAITSKHTSIGNKRTLDEEINDAPYEMRGSIADFYYNENRAQYFVIIEHAIEGRNYADGHKVDYGPFSVIIYDKNFENPIEYFIPEGKYYRLGTYMTSEGLIWQRKYENLTKDNYGTQTFDLLSFE